ncbi:MAG: CAP domain-containing protein [Chloroflexota bacterium]
MNVRHQSSSYTTRITSLLFLTFLFTVIFSIKDASAQSSIVYLPVMQAAENNEVDRRRDGCEEANSQERAIMTLVENDAGQQRPFVVCNSVLAAVAHDKAVDMATRNYFGHTNPEGVGANTLVRNANYPLPSYYGSNLDSNNIESLAAGYDTVEKAWVAWMESSGHRTHLLGLNSFYGEQVEIGVGYAYSESSLYKHYWVFFSAYSEDPEE